MTPSIPLTPQERRHLLDAGIRSVRDILVHERTWTPEPGEFPGALRRSAATFVTLEQDERLLGCIGALEPIRPLVVDVAHNAAAAAFADPRMPPLTRDEYAAMSVKVSVLSAMEPVEASSFEELSLAVAAGEDGLVVSSGSRRATLLPSVWPKVAGVDEFVRILWAKAGLRPGEWTDCTRVRRYSTVEFCDPGPRDPVGNQR